MVIREASSLGHHSTLPAGGRGPAGAEPGRTNVHVMDLDRPDYHAPGMDQISRGGAPYINSQEVAPWPNT
jgi:hypothetical protein